MSEDAGRFCNDDELWVCPHCGKHVSPDRYSFDDESCMLSAVKVLESDCVYKDGNKDMRIIEVKGDHSNGE